MQPTYPTAYQSVPPAVVLQQPTIVMAAQQLQPRYTGNIAITQIGGGPPGWGLSTQFEYQWAYLAWFSCLFGFCGGHRLYVGDVLCAVLECLTGGFCCIGGLIDLCLIPSMVDAANADMERQKRDFLAQQHPIMVAPMVAPQAQPMMVQPGQSVVMQQPMMQPGQPVYVASGPTPM